ncbi:MAG: hypothetical protein LBN26_09285 [Christensenellaceae bacterium]|nr:hypothetical protein [Christensenellaceae bacterium]
MVAAVLLKTQGIRDKSDHDVAVVHTHPTLDYDGGEVFSGGQYTLNGQTYSDHFFGDATVPSMLGIDSIYVATPKGDILKWSGSPSGPVRGTEEIKISETETVNAWTRLDGQKAGIVTDKNGNKVQNVED